jgi:hypothetical protein
MPPQQGYALLDFIDHIHDFVAHPVIPYAKPGLSIVTAQPHVKSSIADLAV